MALFPIQVKTLEATEAERLAHSLSVVDVTATFCHSHSLKTKDSFIYLTSLYHCSSRSHWKSNTPTCYSLCPCGRCECFLQDISWPSRMPKAAQGKDSNIRTAYTTDITQKDAHNCTGTADNTAMVQKWPLPKGSGVQAWFQCGTFKRE